MTTDNPFRRFFDAGYRRLVPIVPPGAPLSPNSSLAKRIERDATKDSRGKAPGVLGSLGWHSFDWLRHETTEGDLERWGQMGAGVGIRTGGGLVAVDIDTLDEVAAEECERQAREHLGQSPVRVGRWPKRLLVYRCAEELPYRRVTFSGGIVELLTEGRQFVADGIHPATGKPYEWQPHAYFLETLTPVTGQQLDRFFSSLGILLPAAEQDTESLHARANVNQQQLAGDPDTVTQAVEALPNDHNFKSRDDYIRVGAAIKAALPADEDYGLDLYQSWAGRWTDGSNDPDVVAADWRRIKPPFSVGAQYLYSLASQHGGFSTADAWFTATGPQSPQNEPAKTIWDEAPAEDPAPPIDWLEPDTWDELDPPPREWEVEGWIPRHEVTLLYGEGGIGKTLAIHQYAACAAAGRPWLGQNTRQARIMAVFCEDNVHELQRRHKAILKAENLSSRDLGGRLRLVSRAGDDNILASWNRTTGTMQRTKFWHQLHDDAVAWRADVIIVDTIADTFGGSEIDRSQVNSFVKFCLGGLARAIGGSAIALGHPSVAGRGEGRSGSTAWSNAARSRIYLRYPQKQEKGNLRELEGMKANYGPTGALLRLQWKAGAFGLVSASSQIDLNAFKTVAEQTAAAVAKVADAPLSLEAQEEAAVVAGLAAARADGRALNLSPTSHGFAPKVLLREYPELMRAARAAEVETVVGRLLRVGRIRATVWRDPGRRHNVTGFEVVTADTAPRLDIFN